MSDDNISLSIRRRLLRAARRGAAISLLITLVGTPADAGSISDWFSSLKAPAPDTATPEADTRTNGRLMNRWMTKDKSPFSSGLLGESSTFFGDKGWEKTKVIADPVSEAEFEAAKKLFDAGQLDKAEPLFAKLAKREVKKGTMWGAKAQFYLAESQFRRQRYTAANDNYQFLLKKYTGETEYVDRVIAREYQIAQIWLAEDGSDPKNKPLPFKARFDGRQPMLDPKGYAIKTLESVRMHDTKNGPLADYAVLQTADYYHRTGDYEQAAIYYDQLLNDHAKSPLRERAQLSAIDARVKGYIGPAYDSTGLDGARDLVKRTMEEFPEHQATNEQLYHTLDLINDQAAEKEYENGLYYIRALKPASAEYQFGLVIAKWPKSKWAEFSKVQLKKTAKMPRKASVPSKIMTLPGAPDPNSMGQGQGSGSGGGGFGSSGGGMGGAPF